MTQPIKDAVALCKTIQRNGYDAYVINARLQHELDTEDETILDIATDLDFDELIKLFPHVQTSNEEYAMALLREGEVNYYFYPAETVDGSHPEVSVARITNRMLKKLGSKADMPLNLACPYIPQVADVYDGFSDFGSGQIALGGLPDETLKRNYLSGVRALRFAANYHLPIEANTWMAIVRNASAILDYVSITDIMDEWRKVEAENLWSFVRMLFDCQLLHGLIPEVAALSRVEQVRNETGENETVLNHTIEVMHRYPEELPYDWYGTMACMFHDVGKLYTAEFFDNAWTFYQHHQIGAKVTRRILNRLRFSPNDIDLLCLLVRNHMRLNVNLTARGIRRFKALDDYPRVVEMARANIKAREGSYAAFNHNIKMLEQADIPEEMQEPLLNGKEIMDFTGLMPGPTVGIIRESLLKAQVSGDVTSIPEAVDFVLNYQAREKL